jgi:hypothetical protein
MPPPQETEDKASTHAITIRLPEDMYEDLRRQAYEQRTSINALIVEAVRAKQDLHAMPRRVLSCRVGPRLDLPSPVWPYCWWIRPENIPA